MVSFEGRFVSDGGRGTYANMAFSEPFCYNQEGCESESW